MIILLSSCLLETAVKSSHYPTNESDGLLSHISGPVATVLSSIAEGKFFPEFRRCRKEFPTAAIFG